MVWDILSSPDDRCRWRSGRDSPKAESKNAARLGSEFLPGRRRRDSDFGVGPFGVQNFEARVRVEAGAGDVQGEAAAVRCFGLRNVGEELEGDAGYEGVAVGS
jgi:hypothetical protein